MAWRRLGVLTLLLCCRVTSAAAVARGLAQERSLSRSDEGGQPRAAAGWRPEQQKRRGAAEDGRVPLANSRSTHGARARKADGTPEEDAKISRALRNVQLDDDDPAIAAPVIGPGSAVEAIRAGKPLPVPRKPKRATAHGGDLPRDASAASLPKESSALSERTSTARPAGGDLSSEVDERSSEVDLHTTPPPTLGELPASTTPSAAAAKAAALAKWAALGDQSASEKKVPTRPMPKKKPKTPGCYMFMPSGCPNQGPENDAVDWTHDAHAERKKMAWQECETTRVRQLNLWCGTHDVKMLFIPRPDQIPVKPLPPQAASKAGATPPQELLGRPWWPLPHIKVEPKEVVHEKKKLHKINTHKEEEKQERRRLKRGDSEEPERPLKPWYIGEKFLEKMRTMFHKKKWQSPEAEAAHQRAMDNRKREQEVQHMKVLDQAGKDEAKRIKNTPKQRLWNPPKSILALGLLETATNTSQDAALAPASSDDPGEGVDTMAGKTISFTNPDGSSPCNNMCARQGSTATCTMKIWQEAAANANRGRSGERGTNQCWDAQITIATRCPQCIGCMQADARCEDFLHMNPMTTTPAPAPPRRPPAHAAPEGPRPSPEASVATENAAAASTSTAPAREEGGSGEGPAGAVPLSSESFCCLAAPVGQDACGFCEPKARLGKGSWCSESRSNCEFCQANATYCTPEQRPEQIPEKPKAIIRTSDSEEKSAAPAEVAGEGEPVQAPEQESETPISTAGSVHREGGADQGDDEGGLLVSKARRVVRSDAERAMQGTGYQAGAIRAAMDAVRKAREPKMERIKHLGPSDRRSGPEAEMPTEMPAMTKREVQELQRKELRAARSTAEAAKKSNIEKHKRHEEKEAARYRLQSHYVLADPGHRCLPGLKTVSDLHECSLVARIYNAKDNAFWGKRWIDRPRGCFLNVVSNMVTFNSGKGGQEADQNFQDRTVCVPSGAGLPTVPPGFEQAPVYDPTADKQLFASIWQQ